MREEHAEYRIDQSPDIQARAQAIDRSPRGVWRVKEPQRKHTEVAPSLFLLPLADIEKRISQAWRARNWQEVERLTGLREQHEAMRLRLRALPK